MEVVTAMAVKEEVKVVEVMEGEGAEVEVVEVMEVMEGEGAEVKVAVAAAPARRSQLEGRDP